MLCKSLISVPVLKHAPWKKILTKQTGMKYYKYLGVPSSLKRTRPLLAPLSDDPPYISSPLN